MQVVLASDNLGKLKEFQTLLRDTSIEVIPQSQFSIPQPEETGLSFVENAIAKARHACLHTHKPAIGDDSGLEVDALDGDPGIYSARYAGLESSSQQCIDRLLKEMADVPASRRQARYCCALAYLRNAYDPLPIIAYGFCSGMIATEAKGDNGFGYDPIMYIPYQKCTAAQLDQTTKNQISHRAKALNALIEQINTVID